ncbi:hypothetical protein [Cyanobium sp. ULC082]
MAKRPDSRLEDLFAALYLICFAVIAGGAFALMSQNLRRSAPRITAQPAGNRRARHPEAPQPGEEVMYVDLNRERLEQLFQQAS